MANVVSEILVRIGAELSGFQKTLEDAGKSLKGLGDRLTDIGAELSKKLTLPLAGLGAAAFKAAYDLDDALDSIRIGTGETGEVLRSLQESFRNVMATVPDAPKQIAQVIADLNTRLGLTGPALESLARQVLAASRMMGIDSASMVRELTRTLGDWGISAEHAPAVLDKMFVAAQKTGIGMDRLGQLIVQYGAPLRQMGFSFEQAAAMLAKWEKEGVNTELVLGSLRIALVQLAKDGVAPAEGLRRVTEQIKNAGSTAQANAIAVEYFGARAGPDMAAAIREGRFEIGELVAALQQSGGAINQAVGDTYGFAEAWGQFKNRVMLALEPVGNILTQMAERWLPRLSDALERLSNWWTNLSPSMQQAIVLIGGITAAFGPLLLGVGSMINMVGTLAKAFGTLPGPVGIAIAAIYGLAVVGTLIYTHWDEIKAWLSRTWESIKARAVEIWTGLKQWLVNWWPYLIGALGGPVGIFAAWVYKNWDSIKQQAVEAWNRIKEAVLERVRTWVEIGTRLAEGIVQGLQNTKEWLKARVIEWAKAVLPGPLERLLGIASPSALMAYYGQMVAEGLAQGVESGYARVKTAADKMAEAISGAVSAVQERVSLASDIINARFELMAAQMGANVSPAQALQLEFQKLQQQMSLSQQQVEVLSAAYERMKAVKGEAATETQKLYLELLRAQIAQVGLAKSIAEVTERLKEQSAALDETTRKLADQAEAIQRSVWGKYLTSKGIQEAVKTGALTVADLQQVIAAEVRGAVGAEGVRALFEKLRATYYEAPLERVKEMFRRMYGLEPPSLQGGGVVLGSRPVLARLHPPELVAPLDRVGELVDYNGLARAIAQHQKPSVHLEIHVHSPELLSPSEVARRNRQMLRELALEWGLV